MGLNRWMSEWAAPALAAIILVCLTALVAITINVVWEFAHRESAINKERPEFGTLPPDCRHVHNRGEHKAWAACMGVEYK